MTGANKSCAVIIAPSHDDQDDAMQKRRSTREAPVLPVTANDKVSFPKRRKRRITNDGSASVYLCGTTAFITMVVALILLALVFFIGKSLSGGSLFDSENGTDIKATETRAVMEDHSEELDEPLPLAQFETVTRALAHSNLVGLYYAASWCPMSTSTTNLLKKHFASVPDLLYTDKALPQKHPLAIVHVSSDTSDEAMRKYAKDGNWITVPFESEERTDLKKHFQVCAKREMEELGFERKFEIPTLIILDGKTHGVITTNGVGDLKEHGVQALEHWKELQDIIRGLESKYL